MIILCHDLLYRSSCLPLRLEWITGRMALQITTERQLSQTRLHLDLRVFVPGDIH